MAGKIRFYLDEHVPRAVATGLRMRGIDVLTAQEAGLLEAPDADHLTLAMHQGRTVHDWLYSLLKAAPWSYGFGPPIVLR